MKAAIILVKQRVVEIFTRNFANFYVICLASDNNGNPDCNPISLDVSTTARCRAFLLNKIRPWKVSEK